MATKKKIKIGLEASFENLDEVKASLESLKKTRLSPIDTASVTRALKELEDFYKKNKNKELTINEKGESEELEKLQSIYEHISQIVRGIRFPEKDIEAQITSSKKYLELSKAVKDAKEKELEIQRELTQKENELSRNAKANFKAEYEASHPEGYSRQDYNKAEDVYFAIKKKDLLDAKEASETAEKALQGYYNQQVKSKKIAEQSNQVDELKTRILKQVRNAEDELTDEKKQALEVDAKRAQLQNKLTLSGTLKDLLGYNLAVRAMNKMLRETVATITELDKAFTEMAMVSTLTREEAWWLEKQLFSLADQTGATATEVAELTTFYLQQGRSLNDAIELTEVAAKSAKVAGIATKEAADLLTTAINGFGMAASEAESVADKFARLAAVSATNFEEMATALSKVASQANMAGMSMDFTLGLLAKGIETTRESPESIGTALKTVIARMQELSDFGKTLEDGMDVNRVETMLSNLGIALRDSQGELRSLEDVIKELGGSWDSLTKNQKAGIAVALAGTRQQSRLISMMDDFERTLELTNEAQQSSGALTAQHAVYMQSLGASLTAVKNAYQKFISSLSDNEMLIMIVNLFKNMITVINFVTELFGKKLMTSFVLVFAGVAKWTKIFNGVTKALKDAGIEGDNFREKMSKLYELFAKEKVDKVKDWIKWLFGIEGVSKMAEETMKEFSDEELTQKIKETGTKKGTLKKTMNTLDPESDAYKALEEEYNKVDKENQNYKKQRAELRANTKEVEKNKKAKENLEKAENKLNNEIKETNLELDINTDKLEWEKKSVVPNWTAESISETSSITEDLVDSLEKVDESAEGAGDALTKAGAAGETAWKGGKSAWSGMKGAAKGFKSFLAAAWPIIAITAAITALTMAFDALNKIASGENAAKALSDISEQAEKTNSIKKLWEELEELSSITIKTTEEMERLAAIIDEIKTTSDDENIIKYDIVGNVDIKATQDAIDDYEKKANKDAMNKLKKTERQIKNWSWLTFWGRETQKDANRNALQELNYRRALENVNFDNVDEATESLIKQRFDNILASFDWDKYKGKSKKATKAYEKFANAVSDTIFDIESTDDLMEKVKIYSQSKYKKELKSQYAFLAFLEGQDQEIAKKIQDLWKAFEKWEKWGISYAETNLLINAMGSALSDSIPDEKKREEKIKEMLSTYYNGYEDYLNNFWKYAEKYSGLTESMTGYLNYLRLTGEDSEWILEAMYDASASIQSIQQVAQTGQSLLSKATNFGELITDLRGWKFDIDKILDVIGTYNLTPSQIHKLVQGKMDQSDIASIINSEQEKYLKSLDEAIFDLDKYQRKKLKDMLDSWELTQSQYDEREKALEQEIAEYEAVGSIILTQIDSQQRNTAALAEYNEELEKTTKLMEMWYSITEIDFSNVKEANVKASEEARQNIQELVDKAGKGIITFSEEGLAQINMEAFEKLTDGQKTVVMQYYSDIQTIQNEELERQKSFIEKEFEIKNQELEEQKTVLQERLDAYTDYMDEMERLENEAETNKSREDIAAQLAHLGTATDAESLKKRKELTKQLEDLNKTQLESERELTKKGLEDEISSLDDSIATNAKLMADEIKNAATDFAKKFKEAVGETVIVKYVAPQEPTNNNDNNPDNTNNTDGWNTPSTNVETQLNVQTMTVTVNADNAEEFIKSLNRLGYNLVYGG